MKLRILLFVILSATMVLAQATTPPAQQPASPHQHGMQPKPKPGAAMPHDMHHTMGGGMDDMKATLTKMRGLLDQMKANVAKEKDAEEKRELQLSVDLWESLIGTMEKHMSQMGGGGMGMMHGGMMGGGGMGMMHKEGEMGGCPCCAGGGSCNKPAAGGAATGGGMQGCCCGGMMHQEQPATPPTAPVLPAQPK